MSSSKVFRAICGLGLGVALFASSVQAQPEDKRTYFTFSAPVALPGVTLPAGRYIFRIVDTTTTRKVIQVLSDDQKKPYAMMNTITDTRRDPAKDATVSFYETPRGTAAAVKTWWYPGERDGYQFIYPRTQAKQIAKQTTQPILTTKTETEDTKSAALTRVDATGKDVDVNAPDAAGSQAVSNSASNSNASSNFNDTSANATVFNRNNNSVASNEGVNRTPPQASQNSATSQNTNSSRSSSTDNAPRVARNSLPRTASTLPLVGLFGMLSALGFVTLRYGASLRS